MWVMFFLLLNNIDDDDFDLFEMFEFVDDNVGVESSEYCFERE